MADSNADKTERATPERRKRAREEGDFPRSRDAGAVAASLAVLLALATLGPAAVHQLEKFATLCFGQPFLFRNGDPSYLTGEAVKVLAALALPSAICAALGAIAIGFAQAGFNPQTALLSPKMGRLDPIGRLKEMFSAGHGLWEIAQSVLRVSVLGYVVYVTTVDALPRILMLSRADVGGAARMVVSTMGNLAIRATAALAVLSAADFAFSKLRWEKRNRMSKQECKEEFRQQEGDPRIKNHQRAIARQRLKKNLAKGVQGSDVVVVNPTHVSVALRYRSREGAPVVTAKGYDEVALYIREIAKDANVPVIESRVLARALAERVKVGKTIPVDLYAAVAEVLAFVYRLRGRAPAA